MKFFPRWEQNSSSPRRERGRSETKSVSARFMIVRGQGVRAGKLCFSSFTPYKKDAMTENQRYRPTLYAK